MDDRLTGGRRIGPYELVAVVGQGAMGAVYRGRHAELGVERAIKLLAPGTSPAALARFEREAKNLARVRHANVVQVHEAGVEGGAPYLVMDLVPGRPLDEVFADGPLPLARALGLAADLARGVAALHEAGVVHRDLKPANVIVRDDGAPVIVDLGVAVAPDQDERLTRTGAMVGTPLYMAPEQLLGRAVGPPADVHAVGLILFELATGRSSVPAVTGIVALMAEVSERDRPRASSVDDALPAALDLVLARAVDRRPELRPDATSLARQLDELAAAVAAGNAPSARALRRRRRALIAGALASLGGLGLLVALRLPAPEAPDAPASTAVVAPVPSAATPRVSPRADPEGARQLRRVERIVAPDERLTAVLGWLARWPEHPERVAALALERRARALHPERLPVPAGTFQARFLDERRLVLASAAGLCLWDLAARTAAPPFTDLGAHGPVLVRPDGTILAAAGPRCRVYEPGGRLAGDLDLRATVMSLATSADGKLLVAGTDDGARVVTLPDGRPLAHLQGHARPVWAVAVSPDGRWVVTASGSSVDFAGPGSPDNTARVWDLQAEGLASARVEPITNRGTSIAFLPRLPGAFLVGTTGGRIFQFRVDQTGSERELANPRVQERVGSHIWPQAHAGGVHAIVVTRDGRRAWAVSNGAVPHENELRAWDLDGWSERYAVEERTTRFERIDLSPDEALLVTSSAGGLIELWAAD